MESTVRTIELLNDLVLINNDRILGYERALKAIRDRDYDPTLEPTFLKFIDDSRRYKMQLGTEIQALGHDMEQGTTAEGAIHRAWMALKKTFKGSSEHDMLEECEFGEDAIRNAYEQALEEDWLPAYLTDMLDEQLDELIDAHDEIRSLRDSVH
ncbi:MAG TPA: PA2169 family four-helix-bundle protein [Mucilaginibacter sp.]|nr:PA2169 family four-helix-bundle protein [Mucilaginibacter sp.]